MMIDRPVSREALEIWDQIKDLMPVFGKTTDRFAYLVPEGLSKEVRAILEFDGIFYHIDERARGFEEITIHIPEKLQRKRK